MAASSPGRTTLAAAAGGAAKGMAMASVRCAGPLATSWKAPGAAGSDAGCRLPRHCPPRLRCLRRRRRY